MKNLILSVILMTMFALSITKLWRISSDVSAIGTKQFITDSSFIISTGTYTYKITDTSILKWDSYLFIYNTADTTEFKRGVFTVYDTYTTSGRGSYTTIYLTDGISNLTFSTGKVENGVKTGDKFYCFYKIKSTFKTTQIK